MHLPQVYLLYTDSTAEIQQQCHPVEQSEVNTRSSAIGSTGNHNNALFASVRQHGPGGSKIEV